MTRSVDCVQDGRRVDEELCSLELKPAGSQPCISPECVGVWVLGEWSQVHLSSQFVCFSDYNL